MDDFLFRAVLGGLGVALISGPLGAFVVWRRKAYFGAALSHSALLGVALGLILGINPVAGVLAVCIAVAVILVFLRRGRQLGSDTILGILAHGTLALGLVAVAFLETVRFDLMAYLFGDILSVGVEDLWLIYGGGLAVGVAMAALWRPLLAATVHEEMAVVEGVNVTAVSLAFMILLAVVVALAMKVVGILLVTSLLIIPAAAVRPLSVTPEGMAGLAAVAGCLSVGFGLWGSMAFDLPAGPAIVVAALILFFVSQLIPGVGRK